MRKPTSKYWANRASARMLQYERGATSTINTVSRAYDRAIKDLEKEIKKIFTTFGTNGELSSERARKILNQRIPNPLLDFAKLIHPKIKDEGIRDWLMIRMNAPAYRARITRLQALKEQVYLQSKLIADAEIHASTMGYIDTINDAYYRHLFDIQKGLGVGFNVAAMPAKTIEEILRNPWSGKHFSARVWHNTDVLAEKITETITAGFMSGKSLKKMAWDIEHMSDMGKMAAARLIRTETNYMANAAEMKSYTEAEIDEYMFIATLDLSTSKICRHHDRKVYRVKNSIPGKNRPPLHPWCRSTTRAYLGSKYMQGIQRRARDPVTGETYLVPADMNYEQWYQKHVVNKYGADQAEVMKKKIINRATDKDQLQRYKKVLGKDAPKSLAAFQELKYNDSERWNGLKADYRKVNAYNKIIANEPPITADLKAISESTGVEMVGLEYRLKTKSSYLRKVDADSMSSLKSKIIDETIAGTHDVIRYTYQNTADKLVDSYKIVSNELAKKGYEEFKVKNFWLDKQNPYNGINCNYRSPDGQSFEIQFHTPESFGLKNGELHKMYEEFRDVETTAERKAEITTEMFKLSSQLERPRDIEIIKMRR